MNVCGTGWISESRNRLSMRFRFLIKLKEIRTMLKDLVKEDVAELVTGLNYAQKVKRSLELIELAYEEHGNQLVVANSLGKDSVAVWHLAKRVNPKIRGFIVTTRS